MSRSAEQLQAHFEHCTSLQRLNRFEAAAGCYRALLAEAPNVAQAHYNLGLALKAQGLDAEAAASFRSAIDLRPKWAEALVNLANALQKQLRFTEAEQFARQAVRIKPDLLEALFAHGNLLRDLGRFEAAIARLSQAVRKHPNVFGLRNNLGLALKQMGRLAEAEAVFRDALEIEPGNPVAKFNLGEVDLLSGRFKEGWEGLEYRWLLDGHSRPELTTPLWDGRVLQSGSLLLHADQGIGDTIQFCRYVPLAAERARTFLVVRPELQRLLADLHPDVPVIVEGNEVPEHVFHCSLPSLPRAFGTTIDTIPSVTPYLRADSAMALEWQKRLAVLPGLRVGLVWAGNPNQMYDHLRSIPLGMLTKLLMIDKVSFVSLQKGAAGAQIKVLPTSLRIHDWTDELLDLSDTAALIEGLDLVVGVDTSVIHLAAALGKPVWVLNRFDADWRWLSGTNVDSIWYPTLRQFRQNQPGDWSGVIARVSAALADRVKAA